MAEDVNSLQSGVVQSADVNDPSVRVIRGKNQFPQSFQHPSTCMYGYVDPVAVAKCEVGDVFPYKFVTDLNTFTMKSPLKSQVKMYSAAFKVPMEAIYPRTYDILMSFAQKGDVVPQESPTSAGVFQANSARAILPFKNLIYAIFNNLSDFSELEYWNRDQVNIFFRSVFLLESILSDGGIFAKMNIHVNNLPISWDNSSDVHVFDDFIDEVLYPLLTQSKYADWFYLMHESGSTDDPEGYPLYVPTKDASLWNKYFDDRDDMLDATAYYCSYDRMFELLRTGDWHVFITDPRSERIPRPDFGVPLTLVDSLDNAPIYIPEALNIEPIIAYQLACVHFFNNPKVDYLYTADLWRDNLNTLLWEFHEYIPTFNYNGSLIFYDVVSSAFMQEFINLFIDSPLASQPYDYFFHLFSYHRSLRYGDYFVGSRPEPVGVGDLNVDENEDGTINSLEVARKLQLTRLLHKVAITGPEHSQQVKYIFGGRLPDVPKDVPIRLSKEEFDVEGFETNNTGSAQLSDENPNITTTNLRLSDSKFMFEVEVDEPCWLVMVQYFEAHRIYSQTIDRFAYHYDLYDDFVPDMQFVGDQDVKQSELMGVFGDQFSPYSYHLRNMEYKQRYSYASGGFIRHLCSWAFITDNNDGNPAFRNITPEYIRSSPTEFDRFYKSLTGHSLGSRFHFITMNTNVMAPYRQMVYSPEILA